MDQKTFLAVALSMMVWIGYSMIFVPPKKPAATLPNAVVGSAEPQINAVSTPAPEIRKTTAPITESKNYDFGTTAFKAKLQNVGGSLHSVNINQKHPLPIKDVLTVKGTEAGAYQVVEDTPTSKVLTYTHDGWNVRKTFLFNDDKTMKVRLEIAPPPKTDNISFKMYTIDTEQEATHDKRETMLDEYSYLLDKNLVRKNGANKFNTKDSKTTPGLVQWVGFRDHFTTLVIKPLFDTKAIETNVLTEKELEVNVLAAAKPTGNVYEFFVYAGPQDITGIKKYNQGIERIVAFSNHLILEWPAKAIYYTVPFLQNIVKSWGFSIILVSILVYGLTYPLTLKSMMSMRKMQLIQPKVKAIQERYKNDPQKMNAEIMGIYKKEKVNPLGGCLPFLLQMPVFIALYQALWRSYYFQGKSFLWIKDLAQPDRLFIMPFSLPFLGNEFNILPLLMAGVMFAQQKLATKNIVITDEQQIMQQKMMMYIMPIFIGFIFYKFASGLSLYFTVFYLLSALTQWKMSKIK